MAQQLLTTHNVFGIITRLLQQVQYGHDITILLYLSSRLLQSCFIMTVADLLEEDVRDMYHS